MAVGMESQVEERLWRALGARVGSYDYLLAMRHTQGLPRASSSYPSGTVPWSAAWGNLEGSRNRELWRQQIRAKAADFA